MPAGFALIAFIPAALGILTGMIMQSWGVVFGGMAIGMAAPVLVFLWLAGQHLRIFSKAAPRVHPEELA